MMFVFVAGCEGYEDSDRSADLAVDDIPSGETVDTSEGEPSSTDGVGLPTDVPAHPGVIDALHGLAEECAREGSAACDQLVIDAYVGAAPHYVELGQSCGGRVVKELKDNRCAALWGHRDPNEAGNAPPTGFPDDKSDGLAASCGSGELTSCDELEGHVGAVPSFDDYRRFGATCAGRLVELAGTLCAAFFGDREPGESAPFGQAGADPVLDAFAASCGGGALTDCDALAAQAISLVPQADDHLRYARTCGERNEPVASTCVDAYGADTPALPQQFAGAGGEVTLDEFADACFAGVVGGCDELATELMVLQQTRLIFLAYAMQCGDRVEPQGKPCVDIYGGPRPPGPAVIDDIGRDEALDRLASLCADGNADGCNDLRRGSPPGSGYSTYAQSCGGRREPEPTDCPPPPAPQDTSAPDTVAPGTVAPGTVAPGTVAPDTVAPDTVAPDTVAPDTTVPDTTVPDTTVPDTTVPDTTSTAVAVNREAIEAALSTVSVDDIDISALVAASGTGTVQVRVPFAEISPAALRQLEINPQLPPPFELVDVGELRQDGSSLIFDMTVNRIDQSADEVMLEALVITLDGGVYTIDSDSDNGWLEWLLKLFIGALVAVAVEETLRRRWPWRSRG